MKHIRTACKQLAVILSTVTLLTACESAAQKEQNNSSDSSNKKTKLGKISKRTQDGCYMRVSGNQMRDTQYVQLHIQNNKVSGTMIDDLYEKDKRKGTLAGTVLPNKTISAVWTYMQEGQTDTMRVALKLDHTGLFQKPLKADMSTGRQTTDNTAGFTVPLKPTDCNKE
jgi:hypothetical protein